MRALLLIILSALFFNSCGNATKDRAKDKEQLLQEALENAENTAIKTDTIFLGLRFGMSEKEVTAHLDSLVSINKLYISDDGHYTYDFNARAAAIQSKIGAKYHNDKLYRFYLSLRNMGSISDSRILSYEANEVFKAKATADGYTSYTIKGILDEYEFYYIKNNLIVEISSGSYAMLSYTNAPILKLIKAEQESDRMSTISDL